jgi:hypothetical protein
MNHYGVPYPKQPTNGAKLCERCKVLEFDDRDLGGFEMISSNGERYLNFRESGLLNSERSLSLKYALEDQTPHLPQLKASAEAGCEFCRLLRQSIQRQFSDHNGDVFVRLKFEWAQMPGFRPTTQMLVADLDLTTSPEGKLSQRDRPSLSFVSTFSITNTKLG